MILHTKARDGAVSPVVGVMLMLVVTIIIAAVVSAFAGGMTEDTEKAPSGNFKVRIANDGTWGGSNFHVDVLGVSEAIPTKDLKIVTSWTARDGTKGGASITAAGTTQNNTYYSTYAYHAPLGFGPGVEEWVASGTYKKSQNFGNYSLMAGTRMHNSAAGYSTTTGGYGISPDTRYEYSSGTYMLGPGEGRVDAMTAILGEDWNLLQPGDLVNVRFIHIPSGKMILDVNVPVEG